jgi:hypothetical protein
METHYTEISMYAAKQVMTVCRLIVYEVLLLGLSES